MTNKIESLVGDQPAPFDYGNKLVRETVGGHERLRVGASGDQHRLVLALASTLTGQCQVLYVLHTTRIGAELGRYESPELDAEDLRRFFREFGRFLSEDARHDVWLHSHDDEATIVLDRHNLIYAYGPVDTFEDVLLKLGVRHTTDLRIPEPHVHHYNAEWDDHERAILESLPWTISPLQESDIQWRDDEGAG